MKLRYASIALGALAAAPVLLLLLLLQITGLGLTHTGAMATLAILLGVWITVTDRSPAVGLGLWVLAFTNTVPFVNFDVLSMRGVLQPPDALILALLLGTALPAFRLGFSLRDLKWQRRTVLIALLLLGWWAFTLVRTWGFGESPLSFAALNGRDLLYMPLALICATCLLRRTDEALRMLALLAAAASLYAAAYLFEVLLGASMHWIVHPYRVAESAGLLQPFQFSNWLAVCMLPVAFWRSACGRGWQLWLWRVSAVVLAAQVLVALTRANYVGVAVGLVASFAAVYLTPQYSELRRALSARWVVIASAAFVVTIVLIAAMPAILSASGPANAVTARISSLLTIAGGGASSQEGNWVYRVALLRTMSRVLGGNWAWGLGFLHPSVHYVAALPSGSIRNTDVGLSWALMPMGLVGALLVFIPSGLGLLRGYISDGALGLQSGAAGALAGLTAFFACVFGSALTMSYATWPVTGVLIVAAFVLADGRAGTR